MKKLFRILMILLFFPIIAQLVLYWFIDSGYLAGRNNVVENLKFIPVFSASGNSSGISAEIPSNALNVQVSHDFSFFSYIKDGKLVVVDAKTKKAVKTIDPVFPAEGGTRKDSGGSAEITCCEWIPGKNLLMYALSSSSDSQGRIQLMTCDLSSGSERSGAKLTGKNVPKGSRANDIIVSPLNMVTYVKVKTGSQQTRLFRVDINDIVSDPVSVSQDSPVRTGYYSEDVFFQDESGKLFSRNGTGSVKQISFKTKVALLNTIGLSSEGKDRMYAGELNGGGKVVRILYGSPGANTSSWSKTELRKPAAAADIVVSSDGVIYCIDKNEKTVLNVASNKKTTFSGNAVGITDGQIVYLDGNKVKSKTIE